MKNAWIFAVALIACTPPSSPVDEAHGRAAITHMGLALHATAKQCTAHAQWLAYGGAKFDFGAPERATELSEACTKALIPARDAVVFAIRDVDRWTPEVEGRVACAGLATQTALESLHATFVANEVKVPPLMLDGIIIGRELGARASRSCDPIHPTTEVTVYR